MFPRYNCWPPSLIFEPFGNNETFKSFLQPSGIFLHHLVCWQFLSVLYCHVFLSSPRRFSMGFRSGLIAGQFKTVHLFLVSQSFVLLDVCFGRDLRLRPSFLTPGNTFLSKMPQ